MSMAWRIPAEAGALVRKPGAVVPTPQLLARRIDSGLLYRRTLSAATCNGLYPIAHRFKCSRLRCPDLCQPLAGRAAVCNIEQR
jgi:hypothetical protein